MRDTVIRLAQACGVEPSYSDNWGKVHFTDPVTARTILEAKGVTLDWTRLRESVQVLVVSNTNLPPGCSIRLFRNDKNAAPSLGPGQVNLRVVHESGEQHTFALDDRQCALRIETDPDTLILTLPFPRDLPLGVNTAAAEALFNGVLYNASCRWIVCPGKAFVPTDLEQGRRIAGIAVALYGVRSRSNWGVGDFGDLMRIIDWAVDELHVDCVGLNPLHAVFNRGPFGCSPYSPSSRLYHNYIYLDVPAITDFADSKAARDLLESPEIQLKIGQCRDADLVQYEPVARIKLQVLKEVFRTFMERHGKPSSPVDRWARFRDYMEREGVYLRRFATFCALEEHFMALSPLAHTWHQWPDEYRDPQSEAVRLFRKDHEQEVLFWMYVQWQIEEQLSAVQRHALEKGMLIGLYHDEALAVDTCGADVWAAQDCWHTQFTVGAPPDALGPDGQNWGFPPPDTDNVQNQGYEPFLRRLAGSCRQGGGLRIDHVMQFNRLFWIPSGQTPTHGVYVKEHEDDLLNLLTLESQRNRTLVIGEDLGTVPEDFRDHLMARGIFSYRVFYFERDAEGTLTPQDWYPHNALVCISTHDLPPFARFWGGLDIDERKGLGLLEDTREQSFRYERHHHKAKIVEKLVQQGFLPAEVAHAAWIEPFPTEHLHAAVIKFVAHTPSRLVVVSQEDLFLDLRQQNMPGTTTERPNWSTKMRYSVEELTTDPEARAMTERFRNIMRDAGRSHR